MATSFSNKESTSQAALKSPLFDPTSPCVVSISPKHSQPGSEKERSAGSECSGARSSRGLYNHSAAKTRDEGDGGEDDEEEEEHSATRGLSPRVKNGVDAPEGGVFAIGGGSMAHNSSYYPQSAQQSSNIQTAASLSAYPYLIAAPYHQLAAAGFQAATQAPYSSYGQATGSNRRQGGSITGRESTSANHGQGGASTATNSRRGGKKKTPVS